MKINVNIGKESESATPLILDGRKLRDEGILRLKARIERSGVRPTLAILQVGNVLESAAYISQKKQFGEKIGAHVLHTIFPEEVTADTLIAAIRELNADSATHGIILQLPVPARLEKQKILDAIAREKDADGLTAENKRRFEAGDRSAVIPATARGVLSLLKGYGIKVSGKKVAVIGRSALVGAPIAVLLLREGASVTVCHRGTPDIPALSRAADILIAAVGSPHLVTKEYVSPGQTVVDVGINSVAGEKLEEEIPKHKLVGDVDFDAVKDIVGAISPVPGGVGPMTVLSLFENVVSACETQRAS